MIEIPEAATIAAQLDESIRGKRIASVVAGRWPHKWAWFHGPPESYGALMSDRVVARSAAVGGFVDVDLDGARLLLAEGVVLRFHGPGDPRPDRHQLQIEFDDGTGLTASVQMYGGLWAFPEGTFENPYYAVARERPTPLDAGFDRDYFERLLLAPGADRWSVKALLATEQRIPGFGNGVLQDVLYGAGLHPKHKVGELTGAQQDDLFSSVKGTLREMTRLGGRDTERDIHGRPGGYVTRLSRKTVGRPCPRCGRAIEKAQYLGGAVYFCAGCQAL